MMTSFIGIPLAPYGACILRSCGHASRMAVRLWVMRTMCTFMRCEMDFRFAKSFSVCHACMSTTGAGANFMNGWFHPVSR